LTDTERDRLEGGFLSSIEIRGFRSARNAEFSPRPLCALVGEARSGRSTLLAAIRAVLDPTSATLSDTDPTVGESDISIPARLAHSPHITNHLRGKQCHDI
jgi:predicted ATP-dependent endonuclease of OLD family